jgi:hypothetical protein
VRENPTYHALLYCGYMKMEGYDALKMPEEDANPLRKATETQVREYAKGLDPDIQVDTVPFSYESDGMRAHISDVDGTRFVFTYKGETRQFSTEEVDDRTAALVEKFLRDFHTEMNSIRKS